MHRAVSLLDVLVEAVEDDGLLVELVTHDACERFDALYPLPQCVQRRILLLQQQPVLTRHVRAGETAVDFYLAGRKSYKGKKTE